jgi:hypothetical protein
MWCAKTGAHISVVEADEEGVMGRGCHTSISQFNVSRFYY